MQQEQNSKTASKEVKKRLNLPLEAQRRPVSEWIYEHRVSIFVSIIIYLSLLIFFITGKIVTGGAAPRSDLMYFEAEQFETLQAELERAEEDNRRLQEGYGKVRNLASNESAAAGDGRGSTNAGYLRDDRGTDMKSIYEYAEQVEASLRAGSEAYSEGVAQQQALINSRRNGSGSNDGGTSNNTANANGESSRVVEGNVTASYLFKNPVRSHVNLVIPAYRCRGGGYIVVNVTINRNGDVTSASVDSSSSSSDYCMTTAATEAAYASRFNVNADAPQKQNGTIMYSFVPQ